MEAAGASDNVMTPQHPRWAEFAERLGGPEGCDFGGDIDEAGCDTWKCNDDHSFARLILARMGFTDAEIEASCAYYTERGGACDCEILLNIPTGGHC